MAHCYIIQSKKLDKFYIGACNGSLEERLDNHNNHAYGNHRFTAKASDWAVVLVIKTDEYSHAIRLERKIKSMKSSQYIRNLLKYPELVEKIFHETK